MIEEIQNLIDSYLAWLKDKTVLRQVKDWVEITTPFLDRHNDYLQIYAKRQNGNYLLTDDGYVLKDLDQSGCKLESPKRQALLKITLNGFGVQEKEGRLEVHASSDNFSLRKHNFIQAMLAVNDLFYLAVPVVASLFYEDVVAWLDLHEIRYTPKLKVGWIKRSESTFKPQVPHNLSSKSSVSINGVIVFFCHSRGDENLWIILIRNHGRGQTKS